MKYHGLTGRSVVPPFESWHVRGRASWDASVILVDVTRDNTVETEEWRRENVDKMIRDGRLK